MSDNQRVVVTGGAGFIGSHLCDALIARGDEVIAVDNFLTGAPRNVAHLEGHQRFTLVRADITEGLNVAGPVALILHFASPASPVDYLRYPLETMQVGSAGTLNCLRLAQAKGARFLLASTSECYGDPQEHPQTESYWGHVNSIGPRAVYDEAKRFAEALTMAVHRTTGLDTRIVRIFNTYGPRMKLNDGRVVPAFVDQALRGAPLTVFGDGTQTRSFCFVSDLISGILKLAALPAGPEVHHPVNLGNPQEISIRRFAEVILQMFGLNGRDLEFRPLPEDDPRQRCPDISRARTLLGWAPVVTLEDGLRQTVEYFRGLKAR
jgi:dTDP-glucose 4,6-dehydratase